MRLTVLHTSVRPAEILLRLLDDAARRRALALEGAQRDRFVTGQALLRVVAAPLVGLSPDRVVVDRTCPRCGGAGGRPRVEGTNVRLNLSYAGTTVVLAVGPSSPRTVGVGVDVEPRRRATAMDRAEQDELARVALRPEERHRWESLPAAARGPALLRWWTRKESVLKAMGHGLAVAPTTLRVAPPGRSARVVDWDPEATAFGLAAPVAIADIDLPDCLGTVAALGVSSVRARVRRGPVLS